MAKRSVLESLLVGLAGVGLVACGSSAATPTDQPDVVTPQHVVQMTAGAGEHGDTGQRPAGTPSTRPTHAAPAPTATTTSVRPSTASTRADQPALRPAAEPAVRLTPKPSHTSAPRPGRGTALAALATLAVRGRAPKTGYDRDRFGPAWSDDVEVPGGHNGCDTRNDVLRRDLRHIGLKPGTYGCVVLTGTLADPYTATRIPFTRGVGTSRAVQIDHVVALSNAWQTGAKQLSTTRRQDLAGDPLNLWAVQGRANMQKQDGDAATWLPSNKAIRCLYVARQVAVKQRYHLWVTPPERDAIARILSRCPSERLPTEAGWATPAPDRNAAPAAAPPVQAAPRPRSTKHAVAPVPLVATPKPPAKQADGPVYYKNCDAARAAGAAPVHRGDPGYARHLDRDGDGVGCE